MKVDVQRKMRKKRSYEENMESGYKKEESAYGEHVTTDFQWELA